ncbi:MAG: sel1 repeat family protein [bacterium]|nr:sel1 repeat family protein [bacterium]
MSSYMVKFSAMLSLSLLLVSVPFASFSNGSITPGASNGIAFASEPQDENESENAEDEGSSELSDKTDKTDNWASEKREAASEAGDDLPFDMDLFEDEIKEATIKEMIKWLETSAGEGNAAAQFLFGILNLCGDAEYGVAEDEQKGLFWLAKSADQNNPIAQFVIAAMQLANAESKEDIESAIALMQKAGDVGSTLITAALSESEEDSKMAEEYIKESIGKWLASEAEQGDRSAQFFLGVFMQDGDSDFGIEKDTAKSLEWLKNSADDNNALAQFLIGTLCVDNEGTNLRQEDAPAWFLRSAKGGFAPAQFLMGMCCETGFGVKKSVKEARNWYKKASAQDFQPAKEALKALSK